MRSVNYFNTRDVTKINSTQTEEQTNEFRIRGMDFTDGNIKAIQPKPPIRVRPAFS
jgi:hypothetical protein